MRPLYRCAIALCLILVSGYSSAATAVYPVKPIRFILGQSPGGGTDILARLYAQNLTNALGEEVIVDNRPGAAGNIGAAIAAKANPDGYTIFMASAPHAIAPSIYPKLPYSLVKDFAPISLVARQQLCLVVHPSLPVKSVKELVEYLKARPHQVSYASAGSGAINHLAAEMFEKMAGVDMIHVPYKGTGPSIPDVLSGRVPITFGNLLPMLRYVKSGRLRPLAVTARTRSPALPDVPTLAESGYPKYEAVNWYGILAPAGTPADIISKLNRDIVAIANRADVRQRYASLGAEPVTSTPAETSAFIKKEIQKWALVVKEAGTKAY